MKVKKLNRNKIINEIMDNSLLLWIGKSRKTNNILRHQNSRIK